MSTPPRHRPNAPLPQQRPQVSPHTGGMPSPYYGAPIMGQVPYYQPAMPYFPAEFPPGYGPVSIAPMTYQPVQPQPPRPAAATPERKKVVITDDSGQEQDVNKMATEAKQHARKTTPASSGTAVTPATPSTPETPRTQAAPTPAPPTPEPEKKSDEGVKKSEAVEPSISNETAPSKPDQTVTSAPESDKSEATAPAAQEPKSADVHEVPSTTTMENNVSESALSNSLETPTGIASETPAAVELPQADTAPAAPTEAATSEPTEQIAEKIADQAVESESSVAAADKGKTSGTALKYNPAELRAHQSVTRPPNWTVPPPPGVLRQDGKEFAKAVSQSLSRTGSSGGDGRPIPGVSRQMGKASPRQQMGQPRRNIPPPQPANLPPVEPLKPREDRWTRFAAGDLTDPDEREKVVIRKVRGILNKLTLDNFDVLSKEMLAVGIESLQILQAFITTIFEKAIDEPHFSPMYAKLCRTIMNELPQTPAVDEDGNESEYTLSQLFRTALLNKCQHEFERRDREISELTPEQKKTMTNEEIEEHEYKRLKEKRHMLGNITFIGELYKLEMVTEQIMHKCIQKLVGNKKPDEQDLECVCNLLKTAGKRLDTEKAKNIMDSYFTRIGALSKLQTLPSRIRFMLMDVMELRKDKWMPRRQEAKMKKIEDIHLEAEMEAQRKSASSSGRGSNPERRSAGGRAPSSGGTISPFHEPQGASRKLGLSTQRHVDPSTQTFGPPTMMKQSQRSFVPRTLAPAAPTVTENKFALLPDEETVGSPPSKSNIPPAAVAQPTSIQRTPSGTATTEAAPMDDEKLEKAVGEIVRNLIDDTSAATIAETLEQLKAIIQKDRQAFVVSRLIENTVEGKASFVAAAANIVADLIKDQSITAEAFIEGFDEVFQAVDSLAIDYGNVIDNHASEYLAKSVTRAGLSLPTVLSGVKQTRDQGRFAAIVAITLKEVIQDKGADFVKESFKESATSLKDLLSNSKTPLDKLFETHQVPSDLLA